MYRLIFLLGTFYVLYLDRIYAFNLGSELQSRSVKAEFGFTDKHFTQDELAYKEPTSLLHCSVHRKRLFDPRDLPAPTQVTANAV